MDTSRELHNGIALPEPWPPGHIDRDCRAPLPVPYLQDPPDVIPIDVGRQLFVDDFLIDTSSLTRRYCRAVLHPASPVLRPETELEFNNGHCPMAAPFNDGVWYDPADDLYRLWYQAGWFDGTALATSPDGLHWQRPSLDVVPGTNAVIAPRPGYRRDGGLTWLDGDADEEDRYRMFLYFRGPAGGGGETYTSGDGVHWRDPEPTSLCGDNTSFFYDGLRRRYVFSIREGWPPGARQHQRARAYHEHTEFAEAATWGPGQQVPWARVDELDRPDPLVGDVPQLYDVNAVAYESLLLGAFALFYGPANEVCAVEGRPKFIDLQLAYSRDGFHWHRPDRSAFIPCSREPGTWNYGYIHAAGGLCLVVGDELWFYFGAFSGHSPRLRPGETGSFPQDNAMYAGASTGLATLRRDGFAVLEAGPEGGLLTTRPVRFDGKHLFVNADVPRGELRVEILDRDGHPIAPFSAAACRPVRTDATRVQVVWEGANDLSRLAGEPVRFRFRLREGGLYSFWVSPSPAGQSRGPVAAGGPGHAGSRDV